MFLLMMMALLMMMMMMMMLMMYRISIDEIVTFYGLTKLFMLHLIIDYMY